MSRFQDARKRRPERNGVPRNGHTQAVPAITRSPEDTREEVDRSAENKFGGRSRRFGPTPLRFFPHTFPVPTTLYGILTVAVGVLLIGLLFWDVREVLSPFMVAIVAGILLYPFRKEPKLRPILLVAAIVFLSWLVSQTFVLIAPLLLAYLMAYIIDPVVSWLQRKYFIKRWVLALAFSLMLVGLIVLVTGFMIPVFVAQLGTALGAIDKVTDSTLLWARGGGLTDLTGIPQHKVAQMIDQYVVPKMHGLEGIMMAQAEKLGTALPGVVSTIVNFLMIPFLTFYLIKDYWRIRASVYSFIPQEYQRRSQYLLNDMHEVVGGFLRGDLITSVFQGLIIGIGLYFIGIPGALLLGVVTGLLCLVPMIGGIVAWAIAVLTALTTPDPALNALYVTILFAAQSVLESTIIGPQVMGRHTDLHPLLVIISILIFGYFMGLTGMLLAIPITGLLLRWVMRWRTKRHAELEREKVAADLARHPHHASRSGNGC